MAKLSLPVILSFLLAISVLLSVGLAVAQEVTLLGEAHIDVFIVALDGVGSSIAKNMSHVVEGALDACRVNSSFTSVHRDSIEYAEVAVNVSFTIIDDWQSYRELIETGENIVIVNAHDEVIPVPSGYTREEWTDRIAEAMLERRVTWVHTGLYPFYYVWHQDIGMPEPWGDAGFQRLMSHINKGDAILPDREGWTEELSSIFEDTVARTWFIDAYFASAGRPLTADFMNCVMLPIWGVVDQEMTGAVIRFGAVANATDSGFYVHIGTNRTYEFPYSSLYVPTNSDRSRAYSGVAAAVWTNAWRIVADGAISIARSEFSLATSEGRTKGLENATSLIDQANGEYEAGRWARAIISASEARTAAMNAVNPTFLDTYGSPLAVTIAVGILISIGVAMILKKRTAKQATKPNEKLKVLIFLSVLIINRSG